MFAASKTASVSGGYQIARSLRFNSADSAYLNRTPASAGNRQIWTLSFWLKRTTLAVRQEILGNADSSALNGLYVEFLSDDTLQIGDYATSSWNWQFQTYPVYRDPSAWYHIVISVDTTQATNTNRVKIYVNNTQVTVFNNTVYPSQNFNCAWNTTQPASIGRNGAYNALYNNGYLTEIYNIDGQALTPSSFGETNAQTGVWQPKAYSGSYGTNGFYLNFSDNSNTTAATLGKDYSGNGNNWTPNNFSVTAGAGNDSLVDSPTSYGTDTGVGGTVRGNYATLNPLDTNATLSNGNLQAVVTDSPSSDYLDAPCTIGISSGAFYFECVPTAITSNVWCGITNTSASGKNHTQVDASRLVYDSTGDIRDGVGTVTTVASYTTNDVISVAFDRDAGTVKFYKNGTQVYTVTNSQWQVDKKFLVAGRGTWVANFGQRPFAYTAPSGFKALCTQNLPTPTIGATTATQAGKFFNPVLWTGTGANPRTITGVGFQPDWVWGKSRSTVNNHLLFDVVRGVSSTSALGLLTDTTGAEANYYTLNGGVTAFTSDGFTVSGGVTNNNLNSNGVTYVAWNWKANGAGVTNTAGSITSTVSANTTSGFSVVTWTGNGADASIGHGLGVVPSMVIQKFRSAVSNWSVYTSTTGAGKRLKLNSTDAVVTDGSFPTTPTSSVFYINGGSNDNGVTMVAYCFAEVAGYSKFGKYTGNGSTDGPFVYTGFRPAFVLFKRTDATSDWWMYDTKRSPSNEIQIILWPNYSDAEATGASIAIDILSNGFKPRSNNATFNGSGGTYIFMAFAESPQKFSLAR